MIVPTAHLDVGESSVAAPDKRPASSAAKSLPARCTLQDQCRRRLRLVLLTGEEVGYVQPNGTSSTPTELEAVRLTTTLTAFFPQTRGVARSWDRR